MYTCKREGAVSEEGGTLGGRHCSSVLSSSSYQVKHMLNCPLHPLVTDIQTWDTPQNSKTTTIVDGPRAQMAQGHRWPKGTDDPAPNHSRPRQDDPRAKKLTLTPIPASSLMNTVGLLTVSSQCFLLVGLKSNEVYCSSSAYLRTRDKRTWIRLSFYVCSTILIKVGNNQFQTDLLIRQFSTVQYKLGRS